MKKRLKKKRRIMRCKLVSKLFDRECDRFRHVSSIGIRTKNNVIFGDKDGIILDGVEFMYTKYNIDPYLTKRVNKALKNAVFDIHLMEAPQIDTKSKLVYSEMHLENMKLYLHTFGIPLKSDMRIVDPTDPLIRSFYVLEYLFGKVKMIPRNKDAEKAIEYLDLSIVCSAYGIEFCESILSRDKVILMKNKIKTYLADDQ